MSDHETTAPPAEPQAANTDDYRLPEADFKALCAILDSRAKPADLGATLLDYGTDLGRARRFAEIHRGRVRCVGKGDWYVYDGKRWQRDDGRRVGELARECADEALALKKAAEAAAARLPEESNERKAAEAMASRFARAADRWRSDAGVKAALNRAESEPGIRADVRDFDAAARLLNTPSGIADLRTGRRRPHRAEELLSKMTAVPYTPGAECPRWEQFMAEALPEDEMRAFVARFSGYCLTGETREQILLWALGGGSNGKSVLFETLRRILGDYGETTPPRLLEVRQGEPHPAEWEALRGVRLSLGSEPDGPMAEPTVKRATGGDARKSRGMRENFGASWYGTEKHVILANHFPGVRSDDDAIWRRPVAVPFKVRFWREDDPSRPEGAPVADPRLADELIAEAPGILAWCVREAVAWYREGLRIPAESRRLVEARRALANPLGAFLRECTRAEPGAWTLASRVFEGWQAWAKANDLDNPWGNVRQFNRHLEREYRFAKVRRGGGVGWPVNLVNEALSSFTDENPDGARVLTLFGARSERSERTEHDTHTRDARERASMYVGKGGAGSRTSFTSDTECPNNPDGASVVAGERTAPNVHRTFTDLPPEADREATARAHAALAKIGIGGSPWAGDEAPPVPELMPANDGGEGWS